MNLEKLEVDFFIPTGTMLKEYLECYNIKQDELAKKLNVSNEYMDNILKSQVRLSNEIAHSFSKVFDLDANYLLNYDKKYIEFLDK